jgi:4-amino-4-deoxy-L-arabinose transferase-like glycosyltransferase
MATVVQSLSNHTGRLLQWLDSEVHLHWRVKDILVPVIIGLLAACLIFWRLGEGSIGDYDEAAYAEISREILLGNDWNTLRWNGFEFFDKPPVALWITALAYKTFGVNEFAARFGAAVSGVAAIVLACLLGKLLSGHWSVGAGAAMILLITNKNLHSHGYNFVSLARVGQLDMSLILVTEVALLLAWLSQFNAGYLIALGASFGIAIMTKSVGGLLPVFIVAAFFVLALPLRLWWRRELLWGAIATVVIAAPWHIGQLLIWGRRFFDSYLVELTVGYVTGNEGHLRDTLFYIRSIGRGFGVWSIVVVVALLLALYRSVRRRDRVSLFLLSWVAVPLVIFNISRSRIGWYVIPIYPALAILAAELVVRRVGSKWGVALIAAVALMVSPGFPAVGDFNPQVKDVLAYSHYVLQPEDELINYWPESYWVRPSADFYADRRLTFVNDRAKLDELLRTGKTFYVIADDVYWREIADVGEIVYQKGNYVLARTGD